jgi:transcription initiation factor TFIID TATA-box-binding protein
MITEVTLVNAVGGGNVGTELDLMQLQTQLPYSSEYEPEQYPGLYFELPKTGVTMMLFRSGEYHLSGGKAIDELRQTKDSLISFLADAITLDMNNTSFEVRNLVHTGDIGQEIELSKLVVGLGLNNAEYNPQNFPGLVYSTKEFEGTFLIFRSGKIILTGCKNMNAVRESFDHLDGILTKLFEEEN